MSPAVTIVLPVHNVERTLGQALIQVLELAYSMGRRLQIALVDDGSTDGTYEVACELARTYPQVRVLRQPFQRGLGAALEQVRREFGVEQAIAHDGITAVDAEELCEVLRSQSQGIPRPASLAVDLAGEGRRARRMTTAAAPQRHQIRTSTSFRWLRLDEPVIPRRNHAVSAPIAPAFDGMAAGVCGVASNFGGSSMATL